MKKSLLKIENISSDESLSWKGNIILKDDFFCEGIINSNDCDSLVVGYLDNEKSIVLTQFYNCGNKFKTICGFYNQGNYNTSTFGSYPFYCKDYGKSIIKIKYIRDNNIDNVIEKIKKSRKLFLVKMKKMKKQEKNIKIFELSN